MSKSEGLQWNMSWEVCACKMYGINLIKTKTMVISKHSSIYVKIIIQVSMMDARRRMIYLVYVLNDSWDHSIEIEVSIEKARAIFYKMYTLLCNLNFSLETNISTLRYSEFSKLLYAFIYGHLVRKHKEKWRPLRCDANEKC